MWRLLRISVLLLVLAVAVSWTWLDRVRTTSWQDTLWIGVFPLNADGSAAAARHIASLTPESFSSIERFFAREARRYGVLMEQPIRVELYSPPSELPPRLPADAGPLGAAWWSLRMRLYAANAGDSDDRAPPHVRMFVLYHDPETTSRVPHSLGLEKGLVGVVYAYADASMKGENQFVIAHEVLHTLGATDKYDPVTNAPRFPDGFAEPELTPLYPQRLTEIMGGRRALSPHAHEMPRDLGQVVVGALTAAEIRWLRL